MFDACDTKTLDFLFGGNMKKVLVVALMLVGGYVLAPQSAMADPGVSLRIGIGFPFWTRPVYVEQPRREVIVEHPRYERHEVIVRRDGDHDRFRDRHEDHGGWHR